MAYLHWSFKVDECNLKLTAIVHPTRHFTVQLQSSLTSAECYGLLSFNLTNWGRDTMAVILQTPLQNAFSLMESYTFSLFLGTKLATSRHCFRYLGTEQATSHYLNQCWLGKLTQICVHSDDLANNVSYVIRFDETKLGIIRETLYLFEWFY